MKDQKIYILMNKTQNVKKGIVYKFHIKGAFYTRKGE